ncbi:MAG: hypothetical protein F6J95_013445 [Leptolyngbya sp. SIO1E4]|nr:hypothetical protein [Leptolyngbya sp. SIO1E4]
MMQRLINGLSAIALLTVLSACGSAPSESSDANDLPSSSSPTESPPPLQEGPPPPPSSAFIALLSPEQTAEIRMLGVPLVVPTDIPAGFTVVHVEGTQENGPLDSRRYRILYRDSSDRCFLVEYASAGVGAIPETEYRIPIRPPLLEEGEYGLNYGSYVDPNLRAQFPDSILMSDWLPKGDGFYRLAGATYINDALAPIDPCQDLTPEEAVQVVESFALLTDEIGGDG